MAPALALIGLGLVSQGANLGALLLSQDRAGNRCSLQGRSGGDLVPINQQYGLELDVGANLFGTQVHPDHLALGDALLRCANTNNGVHKVSIVVELPVASRDRSPRRIPDRRKRYRRSRPTPKAPR